MQDGEFIDWSRAPPQCFRSKVNNEMDMGNIKTATIFVTMSAAVISEEHYKHRCQSVEIDHDAVADFMKKWPGCKLTPDYSGRFDFLLESNN